MSNQDSKPGLGDEIYSGAAEVGQIRTTIGLVIGSIIGLIFIAVGIYLEFFDKNKHTKDILATVVDANCTSVATRDNVNINCALNIKYTVDGKEYKGFVNTNDTTHVKDNIIRVYIDPANPSDVSMQSLSADKTMGIFIIIFGLVAIGISVFSWWLSRRYKFFAAAEGVGMGVNLIRGNGF
jgi:hypothetical protein